MIFLWIGICGKPLNYVREEYGACTSIRVFYQNAEIEYGLVDMTWIASPLDAGTRRVLEDGYKVLFATQGIDDITIEMLLEKGAK